MTCVLIGSGLICLFTRSIFAPRGIRIFYLVFFLFFCFRNSPCFFVLVPLDDWTPILSLSIVWKIIYTVMQLFWVLPWDCYVVSFSGSISWIIYIFGCCPMMIKLNTFILLMRYPLVHCGRNLETWTEETFVYMVCPSSQKYYLFGLQLQIKKIHFCCWCCFTSGRMVWY